MIKLEFIDVHNLSAPFEFDSNLEVAKLRLRESRHSQLSQCFGVVQNSKVFSFFSFV